MGFLKFHKKIFSKVLVVFLAIAIQVIAIVLLLYYFSEQFWWVNILVSILAILLCLIIINRKENPEFKAPWLVVILLFPIFGIIIYLLFANYHTRPKEAKIRKKAEKVIKEFYHKEDNHNAYLGEYQGVANYVSAVLPLKGSLNNEVTYFPDGQSFFVDLRNELNKAKQFIFLEYFIIGYGVIWDSIHEILLQKVKEGVEIRLIYDDIGSMGYVKNNYYKKLRKEGIKCYKFNSFRPLLSGVYNNRDHRKICIVDHECAFTGGINLSDEYANITSPFGYWKDTGVKVKGEAVSNFITMFLSNYDMASKTISDYQKYLQQSYPSFPSEGFTLPLSDGPRPFYTEYISENLLTNMISEARKSVYISTPYLIPTYQLMVSLRNAARRGIDVRIIVPGIPDKKIIYLMTKSHFKSLIETGVKIYYYNPGFNHAKNVIIDGVMAFVGTVNFDFRSLVHHYEDGVLLFKNPCVNDIALDFNAMISESSLVTKDNFKMNALSRLLCSILNLFSPLL